MGKSAELSAQRRLVLEKMTTREEIYKADKTYMRNNIKKMKDEGMKEDFGEEVSIR